MAGTTVTVKRQWGISSTMNAIYQFFLQINKIVTDLETLRQGMAEFSGSATWDPGSIADGDEEVKEITVTGVALGDFVTGVSFSLDVADLTLTAQVTAADTVTAQLCNNTGGAIDLASGTVYVRVASRGLVDAASDLTASTIATFESQD